MPAQTHLFYKYLFQERTKIIQISKEFMTLKLALSSQVKVSSVGSNVRSPPICNPALSQNKTYLIYAFLLR